MIFTGSKDHLQKYRIISGILEKKYAAGPYSVHLDITNKCNNDCISCWTYSPLVKHRLKGNKDLTQEIPYEKAISLIDELAALNVREIYFTGGGEPFMHPRATDIMEYVKKKGIRCDMSTNFTLIDLKIAERLVNAGIDHMNCSIWAGTKEAYAKTHPNKSDKTFIQIQNMLAEFSRLKSKSKKAKPRLTLYNVISAVNYDDFENMVEFAYSSRADAVQFTPSDIVPGCTDRLMMDEKQRRQLYTGAKKIQLDIPKLEKKYSCKIEFQNYEQFLRRISDDGVKEGLYDRSIIGSIPCYAGFMFLRILATGEVDSCLKSGRIPIGSIYKNTIKELWGSKKQDEFRAHTIDYHIKDPFFNNIGNTTQKGNGCLYCCDNLGWNLIFDNEIKNLGPAGKKIARIARFL